MATTTPTETGIQAVPPLSKAEPKPKHAGGRPPKPVPPPPSAETGSFWQWLDEIPKDDWQHLFVYVWRTGPIVDLSGGGKPITVEKIAQPFDQNYIFKTHGSGGYRFDVCHSNPEATDKRRLRQHYDLLLDLRYPPRVPIGDWVDDPRNKNWEWAKPQLEADAQQRTLKAAEAINGPAEPQSKTEELGAMLDLVQKLSPKADGNQAILIELMKQNDPSKFIDMYEKIASKVNPPANKEESSITMLLMAHMLKQLETKAEPAAARDPLAEATNLMQGVKGLMEAAGVNQNPGAPAKMDTTALVVQGVGDVIGKAFDQFGPYVPQILQVMQHSKDRDLQIAQVNAAKGMNPSRPWEFQGTAANPAVQPPPITAPAPAPHPENAPMTPMVFFSKHKALLDEMFPHFRDWFNNEDGYYVADWIIDRKGRDSYNAVRKDATVSMLMQITGAVPELNAIFQPKPDAELFFTELLCDPDARPPEEDEVEPAGEAS